jgi:stringent starvation protein B
MSIDSDSQGTSTRPYLVRALHDWCTDNGFTPLLAVHVDESVRVPMEFVKNNEIVLNVSFDATSGLRLGNEFIDFKARFGGIPRDIAVPIDHVIAIYARENGQGMAFPVPTEPSTLSTNRADSRACIRPDWPAFGQRAGPRATAHGQRDPPATVPARGWPSFAQAHQVIRPREHSGFFITIRTPCRLSSVGRATVL